MLHCPTRLIDKILKCEWTHAYTAAAIMIFFGIDVMAFLAMPGEKERPNKTDFISWVDQYLGNRDRGTYRYRGTDLYQARCRYLLLSEVGVQKDPNAATVRFTEAPDHIYDPLRAPNTVQISIPSLIRDFTLAVSEFLDDARHDPRLQARMNARMAILFGTLPSPPELKFRWNESA